MLHYINMLTYCAGYKHCYMFNAEKIYCIILYRILDNSVILSMN